MNRNIALDGASASTIRKLPNSWKRANIIVQIIYFVYAFTDAIMAILKENDVVRIPNWYFEISSFILAIFMPTWCRLLDVVKNSYTIDSPESSFNPSPMGSIHTNDYDYQNEIRDADSFEHNINNDFAENTINSHSSVGSLEDVNIKNNMESEMTDMKNTSESDYTIDKSTSSTPISSESDTSESSCSTHDTSTSSDSTRNTQSSSEQSTISSGSSSPDSSPISSPASSDSYEPVYVDNISSPILVRHKNNIALLNTGTSEYKLVPVEPERRLRGNKTFAVLEPRVENRLSRIKSESNITMLDTSK